MIVSAPLELVDDCILYVYCCKSEKTAKFVAFQYMTYLYILNQHLLNQLDQISTYEGVL